MFLNNPSCKRKKGCNLLQHIGHSVRLCEKKKTQTEQKIVKQYLGTAHVL